MATSFAKQAGIKNDWNELIEALVAADVPLYKLENENLSKILSSRFGKMPSRTTMRESIIPGIFESKFKILKELSADVPVVFQLDETRDDVGRNVLNILVGRLDGQPLKMRLASVCE